MLAKQSLRQNNVCQKKSFGWNFFWQKKEFGSKKFVAKKDWVGKNFGGIFFGQQMKTPGSVTYLFSEMALPPVQLGGRMKY